LLLHLSGLDDQSAVWCIQTQVVKSFKVFELVGSDGLTGFNFHGDYFVGNVMKDIHFIASIVAKKSGIVASAHIESKFEDFCNHHIFEKMAAKRM